MAKYTVTHTCGHQQTHELFGDNKSRDRKLSYEAGCVCDACYREQQAPKVAQERAQALAAAQEQAATMSLPTLTGSEKQIAWAESIRAKMVNDKYNPLRCKAQVETDARWFINNR